MQTQDNVSCSDSHSQGISQTKNSWQIVQEAVLVTEQRVL